MRVALDPSPSDVLHRRIRRFVRQNRLEVGGLVAVGLSVGCATCVPVLASTTAAFRVIDVVEARRRVGDLVGREGVALVQITVWTCRIVRSPQGQLYLIGVLDVARPVSGVWWGSVA